MAEHLPVFSVSEQGRDIVVETSEPPPESLPRSMVRLSVAAGVMWCALASFSAWSAFGDGPFSGWYVAVMVVLLLVSGSLLTNIAVGVERAYGQSIAGLRIAGVSAYLGIGLGGLAGTAVLVTAQGLRLAGILVPGAIGVVCLVRAPFAAAGARRQLRYARVRQAEIRNLRRHGRRVPGTLASLVFCNSWEQGRPEFTVDVASSLGRVAANMITTRDRVPQPGSAVVITYTPGDLRSMLIDLGPEARFETETGKYVEPSELAPLSNVDRPLRCHTGHRRSPAGERALHR